MNDVKLIGRLATVPTLQHTAQGTSVTTFRIAVDRVSAKDATGTTSTDFFSVVAWNQVADTLVRYAAKGRLVVIDGRLQSRQYMASDNTPRAVVEVVARSVTFLDRPSGKDISA
ncbi:single-stranded DNA-binding protein [Sulfobacillus thermosulfidooxidans]|uniref:single-stranded DNA-binding protein n=1 Tax=Sulfobacillus thermosulfidooxidans TaxID=28034 RepID=UPI001FA7D419|nr:single-stranded DNA-binding protein [Sulfobacillus thermosulfidooxidans]